MTEYTYQLYNRLLKKHEVDLLYPLHKSKKNDVLGLIYTYFLFGHKIAALAKKNYDIIHITNHELGFAASILKSKKSNAKIVTTVHDLMRLKEGFNKGFLQNKYNKLVSMSIKLAFEKSDYVVFSAESVQNDAILYALSVKHWKAILLGPRDNFVKAKIKKKNKSNTFNIGYVGAISYRKNIMFLLRTALKMTGMSEYHFTIYGSGPDYKNLVDFKNENNLKTVKLMGFAPEDKLLEIYDSFDIFFYPTLEEGSSLPVLDAQARGIPVLLYKNNKIDNAVKKYCFLASNEDHAVTIITNLMKKGYSDSSRKREIRYARHFSWDNVAKETEQVYKELI